MTTKSPFSHVSDWELEILPRLGKLPHRRHLSRSDSPPDLIILNLSGEDNPVVRGQLEQLELITPFYYLNRRRLRFSKVLRHQGDMLEQALGLGDRYPIPLELFVTKSVDTMIANGSMIDLNTVPLVVLPTDTKFSLSLNTLNHSRASQSVLGVAYTALLSGVTAAAVRLPKCHGALPAGHEAGHILGLWRHCRQQLCLMHKEVPGGRHQDFCTRCLERLAKIYQWFSW